MDYGPLHSFQGPLSLAHVLGIRAKPDESLIGFAPPGAATRHGVRCGPLWTSGHPESVQSAARGRTPAACSFSHARRRGSQDDILWLNQRSGMALPRPQHRWRAIPRASHPSKCLPSLLGREPPSPLSLGSRPHLSLPRAQLLAQRHLRALW
jgi:hypothetical protein